MIFLVISIIAIVLSIVWFIYTLGAKLEVGINNGNSIAVGFGFVFYIFSVVAMAIFSTINIILSVINIKEYPIYSKKLLIVNSIFVIVFSILTVVLYVIVN